MTNPSSKNPYLSLETKNIIDKLASEDSKPLYKLQPEEARLVLNDLQALFPIDIEAEVQNRTISTISAGNIDIKIVRPKCNTEEKLPVILYLHGGGWILGNAKTHDTLIKKLAICTKSVVIFPEYSKSPEAIYPTAINQCYAVLEYIKQNPLEFNINENKIAVAGDSAGGNMATVLALKAKQENGPHICLQALFYPVTDASMDTKSYNDFKDGPWLSKKAMEWFWEAYVPEKSLRNNPHISPLKAELNTLKGLPPTLIITAENDVLRDEGEEYARKLNQAGVKVINARINGTIHDFMMLNALSDTQPTKGAFALAGKIIKKELHN